MPLRGINVLFRRQSVGSSEPSGRMIRPEESGPTLVLNEAGSTMVTHGRTVEVPFDSDLGPEAVEARMAVLLEAAANSRQVMVVTLDPFRLADGDEDYTNASRVRAALRDVEDVFTQTTGRQTIPSFVVGDRSLAAWLERSVLPAGVPVYLTDVDLHPAGLVLVVMGEPGVYFTDSEGRHGLAIQDARQVMGLEVRRVDTAELNLEGTSETAVPEGITTTGAIPIESVDPVPVELARMNLVFLDGRLLPQEAYHWSDIGSRPQPDRLVLHHEHWNGQGEVEVVAIHGAMERQTLYHGTGFEVDAETLRSPRAEQEPEDEREPARTVWERLDED